jgi:hypothetical protein
MPKPWRRPLGHAIGPTDASAPHDRLDDPPGRNAVHRPKPPVSIRRQPPKHFYHRLRHGNGPKNQSAALEGPDCHRQSLALDVVQVEGCPAIGGYAAQLAVEVGIPRGQLSDGLGD